MEISIWIKAPPEKVWGMLALDRWPEWMDVAEVESAKYTSEIRTPEDKYSVGASAHMTEKRWEYDLVFTESLKNERMTVHSKGKYIYTMTFILQPADGGTKLTLAGDFEMPWGVLGKALWGIFSRTAKKQIEKALEKLKKHSEEID
jgi:uncharacterized membrane protein